MCLLFASTNHQGNNLPCKIDLEKREAIFKHESLGHVPPVPHITVHKSRVHTPWHTDWNTDHTCLSCFKKIKCRTYEASYDISSCDQSRVEFFFRVS